MQHSILIHLNQIWLNFQYLLLLSFCVQLQVARKNGMHTTALLTDMNVPIGRCIGNSLEVLECVAALTRPEATAPDMRELTAALGTPILFSPHSCLSLRFNLGI